MPEMFFVNWHYHFFLYVCEFWVLRAESQRGIQVLEIMLILDISYGDGNHEERNARSNQIETGTLEELINIVNKRS